MFFLLTGDAASAAAGGSSMIIMLVAMFAIFYFMIIRPENKKKKKTEEMRNSLSLGDEITTIGGIIGKIVSIKEETCMIETGRDKCRIHILKSAVRNVDVRAEDTVENRK